MEPIDATTAEARVTGKDRSPQFDPSRRRLLLGAAAGALSYPLLAGRASAGRRGGGSLVPEPPGGTVYGSWHPGFRSVRDEFVRNFAERGEVGASVCVSVEDTPV